MIPENPGSQAERGEDLDQDPAERPAGLLHYELPAELIAQHPTARREQSRLLVLSRAPAADVAAPPCEHHSFADLPSLLAARLERSCLLVANDSAVFPARIHARRASGGLVELLVLALDEDLAPVLCRASKKLRDGELLSLGAEHDNEQVQRRREAGLPLTARIVGPLVHGRCRIAVDGDLNEVVETFGEVPLPPYIRRGEAAGAEDRERYQTVYAGPRGSVAAPTAGLHLTQELLGQLASAGHDFATVTLHVGPGTFAPIRGALEDHDMESERFWISPESAEAINRARADGRPVISIGTTTVRALESSALATGTVTEGAAETRLFIKPGHRFRAIDGLVTNFHLPGSTLLALVAAFAGEDRVRQAYADAVARRYRFYSYGDAMLIV